MSDGWFVRNSIAIWQVASVLLRIVVFALAAVGVAALVGGFNIF